MTLIAAWKTPHKKNAYDVRGIRVIADAMLSDGARHPITQEWTKIHIMRPRVRVPISSSDEDWFEGFNHWQEHFYKRFGLFFAGSWLPFSFVKDRVQHVVESFGLKAIYSEGDHGTYLRTEIVRPEFATRFGVNESMHGPHYKPPPPANLRFVAEIVADELRKFYSSLPDGAFVIAPGQPTHGSIQYHTFIGIAGYCDATKQFRIFQLTPAEDMDENGELMTVPKILITEVAEGDLLILGSQTHQNAIRAKIEVEQAAITETTDEVHRQTLARQTVIEREITSANIPGVGGAILRAEVDSTYGFQIVTHPWSVDEELYYRR